jgi:tripartite-type tricarboxylate transporter receptor subunit TctC
MNAPYRLLWIGTALACSAASAQAQTSSVRPMRIIVPYTAGSSSDIRGRIVAQALAAQLEQSVVIDNRPGINLVHVP